ncbi:MAG: DUF4272 domain-containing protein [Anaerolineales bacterium]|nr:DUF4272 domain-containing protein [Anaerolineales bacterium]
MAKPTAQDAAKRLVILKYQVVYSMTLPPREYIQDLYSKWSRTDRQELTKTYKTKSKELVSSMMCNQLWNVMTRDERNFIWSIPPNHNHQSHLNAMWSMESAVALMWALGMIDEFPPFDEQTKTDLLQQVPYLDLGAFFNAATLLPGEQIEHQRDLAELWHWRSRTRELIERNETLPKDSGYSSFDQIVRDVARQAFKQGDFVEIFDDDFPVRGKAYRDLSDEEWSEVRSIAVERHKALNWLCGVAEGNRWDRTRTDT